MLAAVSPLRSFEPGTTGWTAGDLDDPRVEAQWMRGRYEIVEGVLTTMAPAYFDGGRSLQELVYLLKHYLRQRGLADDFAVEVDLIVSEFRVSVTDAAWLRPDDQARQREAALRAGKGDSKRVRILVPPTLIIESVSPGHEMHDRRTKKKWYAEFGVPNYWILDGFARSLQCMVLEGGNYRVDVEGKESEELRPALFPGLAIALGSLWAK